MIGTSKTQPETDMNITDLEQRYELTIAAMTAEGQIEAGALPSLTALMKTVRDTVGDEQISFATFEQFFEWWDVTTAYDQMNEEASAEHHKPALEIAYTGLVREGFFPVDFKQSYETTVSELISSGAVADGELDDYETMVNEIKFALNIDQIRFWDFGEFFDFWEQGVAVASQNMDLKLDHQKPALEVVYRALLCEGFL